VSRLPYRRRGHTNLYPADGQLNLPVEKHSHGLRKLAALEAAQGSFDETAEAIERVTGVRLGKRQVEQLAGRAAVDDTGQSPALILIEPVRGGSFLQRLRQPRRR
jgi:hypothetical protein